MGQDSGTMLLLGSAPRGRSTKEIVSAANRREEEEMNNVGYVIF
jgi:hypothetical protein